ncbi:MAG: hypothetical protein VX498_12070 [Myxococcota bacterium]|nr:hypothetical protein [Myxococcota bacterium]
MRSLCTLLLSSCLLVVPLATALAEEAAGHYDRDRVMGASEVFRSLNKSSRAAFGPVESALVRSDGALAELDLSLALTPGSIQQDHHDLWSAKLDQRASAFAASFQEVQARFDEDGRAYEAVFRSALDRAVSRVSKKLGDKEVVECSGASNDPFAMTGPGRAPGPACPGQDQSKAIAALWDSDSTLAEALEELRAKPWPEITSYDEAQGALQLLSGRRADAPLDGWIDPARLARSLPEAAEFLDAIDRRSEESRQVLLQERSELDPEAPEAEAAVQSIRTRAARIRVYGEEERAKLGGEVWAGLARALKKDRVLRKKNVGICLNPEDWGGCTGPDHTVAVAEALLGDKKLQRAVVKLLEELGRPN